MLQLQRALESSIFYGLLLLIAFTALPYEIFDPWWEAIAQFAIFGFTILWLLEGSISGKWFKEEHRLLVPLFAVALLALVQTIPLLELLGVAANGPTISADAFATWNFALQLLAITLALGLLLRYTSSEKRLQTLAHLIVGIGVASAIFGLLRSEAPAFFASLGGQPIASDSSYGQFENRNHFAFLMEMSLAVVLGLSIANLGNKRKLVLYIVSGVLLWAALLLTHSRGGVFTLLLEIPFFFLLLAATHRSSEAKQHTATFRVVSLIGGAVLVIGIVVASVLFVGGDETIRRLKRTPNEFAARTDGPPVLARPQIWSATVDLIKANPLVGVGFGGYAIAIPQHLKASGHSTLQEAHNDYLELVASGGVIAAALGVWFFVTFGKLVRLRGIAGPERALRVGALAGLFGVAVHSLFDYGLHITVNALVCVGLVVLAVGREGQS